MDNRRYDPQKHAETIEYIQRLWREREGDKNGRYKCRRSDEVEERTGQTRIRHEKDEYGS